MSWFALGGNIGFALAPVTVTPILLVTGLHGTVLLILPAAAAAVIVWPLLRRLVPDKVDVRVVGVDGDARDDWRSFIRLTGVVICRSILFVGMSAFLALYVINHFHQSTEVGSAALIVFTTAGAMSTIAGGWLADRYGRLPTIRMGYLLALPGLLGLVLAPGLTIAFLAAVVCGIGIYIPFSVHTTLGQEYLPNRLGTASGVTLGLAVSAGGIVAPALGALADTHGLRTALAALCVFPITALLISTRLPETHRTRARGPTTRTDHGKQPLPQGGPPRRPRLAGLQRAHAHPRRPQTQRPTGQPHAAQHQHGPGAVHGGAEQRRAVELGARSPSVSSSSSARESSAACSRHRHALAGSGQTLSNRCAGCRVSARSASRSVSTVRTANTE